MRIILGFFQSVIFPTIHTILSHWIPPQEFSFHTALTWTGTGFGTAFGDYFAGLMTEKYGWRTPYYVYGLIGIGWTAIWLIFIRSTPDRDELVTEDEIKLIHSVYLINNN